MDKKKQLQFNLNNFLLSVSSIFDSVENGTYNIPLGHSKRLAYLCIRLAKEYNYEQEGLFDICAYSLLHNISLKEAKKRSKEYCNIANSYVEVFPFLTDEKDILKYQCEYYDGSGLFGLKAEEIPLFSQFISFAEVIDSRFDLSNQNVENRIRILDFVKKNENILFSSDMAECFLEFSQSSSFWLDLQNEHQILSFIFSSIKDFTTALDFEEVLKLTSIFAKITNGNLKLLENAEKMTDFYKFEHKDKQTFLISLSMANIGKLFIPNEILEKKGKLTKLEYEIIKSYPYYTKQILSSILGFSDISIWASRIQEQIDGKGYPYSLKGNELSFKDRLAKCLNTYDSLTNEKSYREAYSKEKAINILKDMANENKIDISIVKDFDKVL